MTSNMTHIVRTGISALVASLGLGAPAIADDIRVQLDYARIARLPEGAQTLVIGNPLVADVAVLKGGALMVVTGKSFGTTNLILLDRTGAQVGESTVTVVPAKDTVIVQRGAHRESLSCNPLCARAVDLGDDVQYMNSTIEALKSHEAAAGPTHK